MNGETFNKYLNKPYKIGNGVLNIGDTVTVHPVIGRSQASQPYEAKIIEQEIDWVTGLRNELCTTVKGGHSAVINDYLFDRLQKCL